MQKKKTFLKVFTIGNRDSYVNSLSIAYKNNHWQYSVVCISSTTLRSFYWKFCFLFFLYISLESTTKDKFVSFCSQAVGLFVEIFLKSDSHLLKKKFVVCVTESPLKLMKNLFYFILKALFFLKIFKFLSWLFGHIKKRLDLKDKVDFKFHDVITWLKTITIHVLPNISRIATRQWN